MDHPPTPPPGVYVQDGPPPGGYPPIDVRRNLPRNVGPSAVALFAGTALLMAYGYYRVGTFNVHRRELRAEWRDVRLSIIPFLQAEDDAQYVLTAKRYREWESKVMEHVPGWNVDESAYHTRKYGPPLR